MADMITWKFRIYLSNAQSFETTMSGYTSGECERALRIQYPGCSISCIGRVGVNC